MDTSLKFSSYFEAVVAQLKACFIGALVLLRYRLDMVSFNRPDPGELWRSWKDVLHVGVPAAGTNVIVPVGAAVVTAMAGFWLAAQVLLWRSRRRGSDDSATTSR